MAVIATVIGIVTGKVLTHTTITQDTCIHDAKVRMGGYNDMYECTRYHKFIHAVITPKEKENREDTAPKYMEDSWKDDD